MICRCFAKGFGSNFYDPRDRNYGQILLQEHLGEVKEWRVIRIGDSYCAYQKGKVGDFHSGSKIVEFQTPFEQLLEFARGVLEKIGMECMAMDVFEDRAGRLFVNELQTYYGANEPSGTYFANGSPVSLPEDQTVEMMVGGKAGRFLYDQGHWIFEEGEFCRNAGCNLRVKLAFQRLGTPLPGYRA